MHSDTEVGESGSLYKKRIMAILARVKHEMMCQGVRKSLNAGKTNLEHKSHLLIKAGPQKLALLTEINSCRIIQLHGHCLPNANYSCF